MPYKVPLCTRAYYYRYLGRGEYGSGRAADADILRRCLEDESISTQLAAKVYNTESPFNTI
jgi:hypothetical protein